MISTTPLPSLGQLLLLRYLRSPGGNALAEPWLQPGDLGGLWMSRSAWSLVVLAEAFRRAHGRAPIVAVPDYICNQSLWPLRQSGAQLAFYAIGDDLRPDWRDCERLGQVDLFVLVHYFGWPNDTAGARAFCDRHGAWLVEDAAHVLSPRDGIGSVGDAILYSQHKLLAVPDGALLVARSGLAAVEHHVVDAARAIGEAHPHTCGWRAKRLIQKTPLGPLLARRRASGQTSFDGDPATQPMARTPAPSAAGAALIARADLPAIAHCRAANAAALLQAITPFISAQPLFRLQNDVTPYRLVLRCASHAQASQLYDRLRTVRLPVESWPDLPPEAAAGSAARRLRATLLLLPCHQDLDPGATARAYANALAVS